MVHISLVTAALAATAYAIPADISLVKPAFHWLETRQTCKGQSCAIADLARSTGNPPPTSRPSGGSSAGESCITKILTDLAAQGRIGNNTGPLTVPPKGGKGGLIKRGVLESALNILPKRAECKPFTLIFARGTTETGGMGITVGPALQSGLSARMAGQWKFIGVLRGYPADMGGNNCIGLPGGIAAMKYLEDEVAACPNTKVVMAGYSQGAMAVHNGIAFAKPEAKEKVIGAVVFGDPFNGAQIKGFDSAKIKTYCAASDGVCQGKFQISVGHLGYVGGDTGKAVTWIVEQAKAAGSGKAIKNNEFGSYDVI